MYERPRISVCMAVYNGEKFLREQLDSIFSQLLDGDELIVSDDGSTDSTLDILKGYLDPRLKVESGKNVGHVGNFERTLYSCSGEVIFLSDQDDIWKSYKIENVLKTFFTHETVAMVHHGYSLIDSEGGDLIGGTTFSSGRRIGLKYLITEFIKPSVFGSCLAIRARCLPVLLGFPRVTYAHDHWAAIVGALMGGVYYLEDHLVLRRIHQANLTPRKSLGLLQRIQFRMMFAAMTIVAGFRIFSLRARNE